MGKMKLLFGGVIIMLMVSGCEDSKDTTAAAFEADSFSKADMCITRIADNHSLCYGDPKSDIEKTLGDATETVIASVSASYASGVSVFYRDDKAVGFTLREGSQGVYQSARGAQIGMSKSEMMSLYGSKYAHEISEINLDYAYDTKTGEMVEKDEFMSREQQMLKEQIFFVSIMFNGNDSGVASSIQLVDQKMAIFLE